MRRISANWLCTTVVILAGLTPAFGATDDERSSLAVAASEADPAKRLAILAEFDRRFPTPTLESVRLITYLVTFAELDDSASVHSTGRELVAKHGLVGSQAVALVLLSLSEPTVEVLQLATETGRNLVTSAFIAKRPDAMNAALWETEQNRAAGRGVTLLGWVAWKNQQYDQAEKLLLRSLELNPIQVKASAILGVVVAEDPERLWEAFYHLTRASFYEPGVEKGRESLHAFYTRHHGSEEGWPGLLQLTTTTPFPPKGFRVKSREELTLAEVSRGLQSNESPANEPVYETRYINGVHYAGLTSEDVQFAVSITRRRKDLRVHLYVSNQSPDAVTLRPENVSLAGLRKAKTVTLKRYSPERYVKRVRKEGRWRRFFAGIAIGMQENRAATMTVYGTTTGKTSGRVSVVGDVNASGRYRGKYDGTFRASVTDHRQASIRTRVRIDAINAAHKGEVDAVDETLLRSHTLGPGESWSGAVYFDREKALRYELTVRVGPKDYSLPFSLDRDGKAVWTVETPPPHGNFP